MIIKGESVLKSNIMVTVGIYIRFTYYVHKARDLHETRIYTIDTILEKNQ